MEFYQRQIKWIKDNINKTDIHRRYAIVLLQMLRDQIEIFIREYNQLIRKDNDTEITFKIVHYKKIIVSYLWEAKDLMDTIYGGLTENGQFLSVTENPNINTGLLLKIKDRYDMFMKQMQIKTLRHNIGFHFTPKSPRDFLRYYSQLEDITNDSMNMAWVNFLDFVKYSIRFLNKYPERFKWLKDK